MDSDIDLMNFIRAYIEPPSKAPAYKAVLAQYVPRRTSSKAWVTHLATKRNATSKSNQRRAHHGEP
jgi:hypothetical protein